MMCLNGRTLAVVGPNRDRVRLFNTRTDDMVGEIGTSPVDNSISRIWIPGSSDPYLLTDPDADPRCPKTYGSYGSGSGTLVKSHKEVTKQ
jgi:hypothetical protein